MIEELNIGGNFKLRNLKVNFYLKKLIISYNT
jgi:hypothetical protein